jgi:pyruvate/2-oxoglutarate dehydrogenase complex dihydrolipoamide dehydrogenase (E3) component
MARYDAIVIGAGQAGPSIAAHLANSGRKVALIEGDLLGGSCVNYGCTPTKTLRKSARVAYLMSRADEFGIDAPEWTVDFRAVMARVKEVVSDSRNGLTSWMSSNANIDVIHAWASFLGKEGDNFIVQAGESRLETPQVFLNTGTRAFIPPVEGIESVPYLDNVSLLELQELPKHLMILGGGYIGIEMAQIFRRLGADVSIIENNPHLASREDKDVCETIESLLHREGISIFTGHSLTKVEGYQDGILLTMKNAEGKIVTRYGSHFLVAVGRTPNTARLNLASVGVQVDERGFIPTNGRLETNVAGIWALGDINKRGAFTHTSYQDYEIVAANLKGGQRTTDGRITTYAMYSDPPMGRVGISENDARASGKKILMATHLMKDVSRAKEESETHGIIKLIVDADTEQFLGACFFGINGDEIIQVISNYMATGASYKVMKDALPVHPTVAEFFPTILAKLKPLE